jgi:hypothetical protein
MSKFLNNELYWGTNKLVKYFCRDTVAEMHAISDQLLEIGDLIYVVDEECLYMYRVNQTVSTEPDFYKSISLPLANVSSSGKYDDLSNKPTIGNAEITIQKNETEAGKFKVNQTSDQTINIGIAKSDVGLTNVDDTSDVDKPISTLTQNALDNKANRFKIPLLTEDFNLMEVPTFTFTNGTTIKIDNTSDVVFNFDDWAEYSFYDVTTGFNYLTLLEWEEQDDFDTYILTLYCESGNTQLIKYVQSEDEYTKLFSGTTIQLTHMIGIKSGGGENNNLSDYIKAAHAIEMELNVDLADVYQRCASIDFSINNSLLDIYEYVDETRENIETSYTNEQIDNKDTNIKEYVDDNFQLTSEKDTSIPITPIVGHYPTTVAVKNYVVAMIADSSTYRGTIKWCTNTGTQDGDSAPTNALVGDTLFDIVSNNYFIVNSSKVLVIQTPILTGNGFYYDITHFVWVNDASGTIKYSTALSAWQETVVNIRGADNITIELDASNNFKVKDGGITSGKIANGVIVSDDINTNFLSTIVNVQTDWTETDNTKTTFIKNKISKSATVPKMGGTASAGTETSYSAGDHVHPVDTSRAAATHTHTQSQITDFPTIGNGTLTIQHNGITINSFTANSTTDLTINLDYSTAESFVPTNEDWITE